MGDTKRQHYVPRTYLKHFSFDGKRLHTFLLGKEITSVITEENKSLFIKDISLSDVCVSQDYYTIDESNSSNNRGLKAMCLEKDFFQDFAEPKLTLIIKTFDELAHKILNDKQYVSSVKFTDEQLYYLALSAFIQYHRSPRLRHSLESVNSIMKNILSTLASDKEYKDLSNIKGLDVAFTHADKTYLNLHLWRMFYLKISNYCILLRVSENGNFFTSDNPVVIHKLGAKGKETLNVNFYTDEFSLFFPLTSHLMLEYYNPTYFPEALKMDKTISIVDSKYENQVNKYQYINAEKFVFSYKNDFSLFLKPISNG